MADLASSIFNKKAADKLKNPDDLDKYVRVTNPSVWVVLTACIVLLAGLLGWGVFGTVTTNVNTSGVCVDGKVMCFLTTEDVSKIHEGNSALVDGKSVTVSKVEELPLSRSEVSALLESDYLVSVLMEEDWVYPVTFKAEQGTPFAERVPLQASIIVERVAPISLALGGTV